MTTQAVHPALTLDCVFEARAAYCPRVSFTTPGWVPTDPALLELVTGRELCLAHNMTVICSASTVTDEGLGLLAAAGLPMQARVVTYRDGEEYRAVLHRLASAGTPLVVQHLHPVDEVPGASYWISPRLLSFINNKGNLAELVPVELLPERRVVATEALAEGARLLRHGPVVVKVATDLSSSAGVGVFICRVPGDVEAARGALGGMERIVLEAFLDIRRNMCVHVVVEPGGQARFLGVAEQVCDERGRYGGNWLGPLGAPRGVPLAATTIAERAAALGYRGFAGIDMAESSDGRLYVLDLNFRLNGSTAAMLLYEDLVRTRGLPVMRLRTWKGLGDFQTMIAAAQKATAQGFLVPLTTYRPPDDVSSTQPPRLLGLVLGTSRDEVRRRQEDLEACGLL